MTRLVNHTSHLIAIYTADDQLLVRFPPHPRPARVDETHTVTAPITYEGCALPRTVVAYRPIATDLPAPAPGTFLIVSRVLAAAHPDRADLVFPLHEVRDTAGAIIGCRALGSFTPGEGLDSGGPGKGENRQVLARLFAQIRRGVKGLLGWFKIRNVLQNDEVLAGCYIDAGRRG